MIFYFWIACRSSWNLHFNGLLCRVTDRQVDQIKEKNTDMKPFTKFILSAFLHYGRRHPLSVGITTSLIFLSAGIQISHFSLSIPPSGEWIAENINAINVTPEKGYTFAVFGDNQNSHVTFSKILEDISHDPSIGFAMGLGDLVFNGETEKYQDFLSQIRKGMKIPLLTAVGNHELYGNGRGLYYELFGPYYYSFSLGKDYFIVLDTGNKQRLDLWQRQWLEKELKNAENASHRFIFMHTPLYDPRQGHHHCLWKQEADSLLELFKKKQRVPYFCSTRSRILFRKLGWHSIYSKRRSRWRTCRKRSGA